MRRIILGLCIFIAGTFSVAFACDTFSFKTKSGLKLNDQDSALASLNEFLLAADLDSKQLEYIYTCLVKETKSTKTAPDRKIANTAVIDQALVLEAGVKDFKSSLDAAKASIANADATIKAKIVGVKTTKLDTYSSDAIIMSKNLTKLVAGLNSDQDVVSKEKIKEGSDKYNNNYGKEPTTDSFIGSNKDKETQEVKDNLVATGGYAQDATGADKFLKDLDAGVYNVAASVEPSVPVQNNNTTPPASGTTTTVVSEGDNTNNDQISTDTETAKELKALTAKLKDMEDKEKENAAKAAKAAASTDNKSSTPTGSASSLNLAGLRNFDAERKKREAEMEERQRQQRVKDILRDVRSKTKAPRSTALAFQNKPSSGSSLFGDFNKKTDADGGAGKVVKPSIFDKHDGKGDTSATRRGDYSSYYGTANIPDSLSSKELAMNRFSSMYEMARRKALIEDAKSEFAGRYIDIFLLQHSIIYDYYAKGLLVDVGEVVTPIEDN